MKNLVKQFVQKSNRSTESKIYNFYNYNDDLIPPESMIFVGAGDFRLVGADFVRHFIEIGNLKPDEKVLDVGCGIGRMAMPLTMYLKNGGSYEGIDVVDDGITWCQDKITSAHPNFKFQRANVYNKQYNSTGEYKAAEYKFPYKDGTFDFIFLTSVFTHMLPQDMKNYLSEIVRVLKRGGRCFITFFLLNDESINLISAGSSSINFKDKYEIEECRIQDEDIPELAIAFDEQFVKKLYLEKGLNILRPIDYGSWCRRKHYLSYQDIVIAIKS